MLSIRTTEERRGTRTLMGRTISSAFNSPSTNRDQPVSNSTQVPSSIGST